MDRGKKVFRYIYGPVFSWRLGRSLGIDLLGGKEKVCSFDCIYCQLGRTSFPTLQRRRYVPTEKVLAEIKALPPVEIDYLTFSGSGEPTLAINLGQIIKQVKKLRLEPIAVLTNASLLYRKQVRRQLLLADLVVAKLDVNAQKWLKQINRPAKGITLAKILQGLRQFRREYRGRLALQIMVMQENIALMQDIARLAGELRPEEVQICTPIRPSPVAPLSAKKLAELKKYFRGMKVISFSPPKRKKVSPLNKEATMHRRGKILGFTPPFPNPALTG